MTPTPEQIRATREAAGLSRAAFGALVHASPRTVEAWEIGARSMPAAHWELAQLKLGLIELVPD